MPLPLAIPAAFASAKTALKAVSPRTWKILAVIVAVGLAVWFVNSKIKAYGQSQYEAGQKAERAAWEEADRVLHEKAVQARTEADKSAAVREARHAQAVEAEREKINEAAASGYSPLDVLFGG